MERNTISRRLMQLFAAAVREYRRVYPAADNLKMIWEDGQMIVTNNEEQKSKRILIWTESNGEVHLVDYDREGNARNNIIKQAKKGG